MSTGTQDSGRSEGTQSHLQRTTGVIVAVSSGVIASLLFFRFTTDLEMTPMTALTDSYLLLVAVFGTLALWSGLVSPVVGQSVQLSSMFIVSLLAAASARPGELTPLIFFGLLVGYGTAYRSVTGHRRVFYFPVTAVFLVVWFARIILLTGGTGIDLLLSFAAASMVVALLSILMRAQIQEQKDREHELEVTVEERTRELTRSLVRSGEFADRNAALLREVHHRTKNNLQVLASLFSLQIFEQRLNDPFARRVINTAASRIQIMADIHEVFHHSDRHSEVETRTFFDETVNSLLRSGTHMTVRFVDAAAGSDTIDLDRAIPFGLLLNEIACMSGDPGTDGEQPLSIEVRSEPTRVGVTVASGGQRLLPGDRREDSITMQIIQALVQQLDGTLDTDDAGRGVWELSIPWSSG